MIGKLLPIILLIIVILGGLFGGEFLSPKHDETTVEGEGEHGGEAEGGEAEAGGHGAPAGKEDGAVSHYRFPSQFFVPVMRGDRLDGMMILTLTVEMPAAAEEEVYKMEFRLRDAFLRTLLIHANTGGFDGNYTLEPRMRRLREALMKTATEVSGGLITDVLIEDIARQDAA